MEKPNSQTTLNLLPNPGGGNRVFSSDQMIGSEIVGANPNGLANNIRIVDSNTPELKHSYVPLGEGVIVADDVNQVFSRAHTQFTLNEDREHALYSAEWRDRLQEKHNNSPMRRMGRRALNSIGIRTSTQKDVDYHQANIDRYTGAIGLNGSDVRDISDYEHVARRDEIVDKEFADNLRNYLKKKLDEGDPDAKTFLGSINIATDDPDSLRLVTDDELVSAYDKYMHEPEFQLPSQLEVEETRKRRVAEAEVQREETRNKVVAELDNARAESQAEADRSEALRNKVNPR